MRGYEKIRDALRNGSETFTRLDAAQLVKHAFALRTAVHSRDPRFSGKHPLLVYLYSEPAHWPGGRAIPERDLKEHRADIAAFTSFVTHDEVAFVSLSYGDMLAVWATSSEPVVSAHAFAVASHFGLGWPSRENEA